MANGDSTWFPVHAQGDYKIVTSRVHLCLTRIAIRDNKEVKTEQTK